MLLVDDDPDFARIFQTSLRADKRVSSEGENASTLESALKILQEKTFQLILKLSFLDPLSQLLNRRRLQRMVSRELEISGRGGANLSVILLDLDNFKPINDTFGHAVGDPWIPA